MKTKQRNGVLGLDTAKAVMISFLILAVTGVAVILALSTLDSAVGNTIDDTNHDLSVINEIASIITTTINILKIVPVEAKKVDNPLETFPIIPVVVLAPTLLSVKILAFCKLVKANKIATAVTARTKKVTITCLAVSNPKTAFLCPIFIVYFRGCEGQENCVILSSTSH